MVEVLSKAFARLPDRVLLPWLPTLITTFKDQAGELVPVLIREAGRTFPATLPAVDAWTPPWEAGRPAPGPRVRRRPGGPPPTCSAPTRDPLDALAALLGCPAAGRSPRGRRARPRPRTAAPCWRTTRTRRTTLARLLLV